MSGNRTVGIIPDSKGPAVTGGSIRGGRGPRKWWQLGGEDVSHLPIDPDDGLFSSRSSLEEASKQQSKTESRPVAPEAHEVYKPVDGFEGAHRFDPAAKWTDKEEQALVRKLNWRIALPACIMFFALQLDRGNISQALSDNMLGDLGMNTNDYNNGMTIFYCSFLFAELPSQLISKKLGPDTWIPIQMVSWSIVAASQAALPRERTAFYVTRFLMGLLEGGFIPDSVLYLSYFFTNAELPRRLSWFWASFQSTQIVSAFLAYGLLHLRAKGSLQQGWRYMFLVEGVFTGLVGVWTWMYLPASPTQTARGRYKGLFRPEKGWFTPREEVIMVTRVLLDDPGKATMHNRQGLNWELFWNALTDYHLWPIYLLGVTLSIPVTPPKAYLTLTCKALGFDTFETNLLTIPADTLFIMQVLFWTWLSEKINQRLLIGMIAQAWTLPLLVALAVLPHTFPNSIWSRWAITTLLVGHPYCHAVLVGLASRNAGSVRTRTIGSSLYNMSSQIASIISSQMYHESDKPYYYQGNRMLLGVLAWNVVLIVALKAYYVLVNKRRDGIWWSMTREQRVHYLATTRDEGNKRLNFRFGH